MSKRKDRQQKKRLASQRQRRTAIITVSVVLSLIFTGVTLSRWSSLRRAIKIYALFINDYSV